MSLPEGPAKKDRRLYAKFDIGMDEHAKIMFLSDAAFRALFESTLYSRRQLTDGFLDGRIVARKWGAEVVAELTSNDPDKPSWRVVEGGYEIHDFAEHQTTTADIEKKRESGRKGGLAKGKQPLSETEAPAKHLLSTVLSESLAKTETETETETSLFAVPDAEEDATRKSALPKSWAPTAAHIERAKQQGVDVIEQAEFFRLHAATHGRLCVSWNAAFTTWLKRAKPSQTAPTKPAASSPWNKDFYK